MGIFRSEPKRCGVLVVELVDVPIQDASVQGLMSYMTEEGQYNGWGDDESKANRSNGTCPRKRRRTRVEGALFSMTGREPGT